MKPVFELLAQNKLLSEAEIVSIYDYPVSQIEKLHRAIYQVVFRSQYGATHELSGADPFNYLASASMRGDSTCSSPNCRLGKLDFLLRFAALYATRVLIPLPLRPPDDLTEIDAFVTHELLLTLLTLVRCRVAIEEDIIVPTVLATAHCIHDQKTVEEFSDSARSYARSLAKQLAPEFTAVYQLPDNSSSGRSEVHFSGPKDFLEHDMVFTFDAGPSWRAKSWRFDSQGQVVLRGARKQNFVERIFDTIAGNTTFFMTYGLEEGARFLSDLPGETILLEGLGNAITQTSDALKKMDHTLPILAELPIEVILDIRAQDRDSFSAYREEIRAITQEVLNGGLSSVDASESFRDRVAPKLLKLKRELSADRKKTTYQLGFGFVGLAASVAIGAYGVPLLGTIPIAAVSTSLLSKAAQRLTETKTDIRQQNDLYFLARLVEEGENRY